MSAGTSEMKLHFLTSCLVFCYKASDFNVILIRVSETEMGLSTMTPLIQYHHHPISQEFMVQKQNAIGPNNLAADPLVKMNRAISILAKFNKAYES